MADDNPPAPANETLRYWVGPIPTERLTRLRDYIASKWTKPGNCPVCDTETWTITDITVMPLLFKKERSIPVFAVYCDNCGFMRFFSAVKSGLVTTDEVGNPRWVDQPESDAE